MLSWTAGKKKKLERNYISPVKCQSDLVFSNLFARKQRFYSVEVRWKRFGNLLDCKKKHSCWIKMTLIYSSWGIYFECKFLSNLSPTYTRSLSDDFKCTGLPFEAKQTGKASMADEMGSRSLSLKMFEICALVLMNVLSLVGNILICVSVYGKSPHKVL